MYPPLGRGRERSRWGTNCRDPAPHLAATAGTHHTACVRIFLGDADQVTLPVRRGLAVQNVLLHHLEVPVLAWNVAMLEGDEDGVGVLALEPLLCLQSCFWPRGVRVQIVLEKVRLRETFSGEAP